MKTTPIAEWLVRVNTERPHDHPDDFTSEADGEFHYAHKHTPPEAG